MARFCGTRYAVTFSSGTAALHAACFAAGLKSGDEALTSPISFAASANCALYQGASVRFADVDPATAQVTADTLKSALSRHVKVLIPVDFTGRPCDIKAIRGLADKTGAIVILDACHSFGARYRQGLPHRISRAKGRRQTEAGERWRRTGNGAHAHMTCFSFHPVKTITTGEGGAVTTDDRRYYERLRMFRHHGIVKPPDGGLKRVGKIKSWYHEMRALGNNSRLTDFQCALGLSQLQRVDKFIAARRCIVERYRQELAGTVDFLAGDDSARVSAHHICPILVEANRRDKIFRALHTAGIGAQVHYIPIYRHPYYRDRFGIDPKNFPSAENYFKRTITLPVFADMTRSMQDRVIGGLIVTM